METLGGFPNLPAFRLRRAKPGFAIATRLLLPVLLLAPTLAHGKEPTAFKRMVAGAEVDWTAGTITARAGSAADIRMPGPNAARPGAERRARASAEEKLRAAARILAEGKSLDEAIKHATVTRIEYQSDGGVVLWLTLRFFDAVPAKPATVSLKVAAMPFEFSPTIAGSGREARLGFATYRGAADCQKDAVKVQRDARGRLILPAAAGSVGALAGAAVAICIEKAQP
jgi:hypothetical protein